MNSVNDPNHLLSLLNTGVTIYSSGTTGTPKSIFRTPENLALCAEVALKAQLIDRYSSVYTVTKMSHAGGLLAQSLPALTVGAQLKIDTFKPYQFLTEFKKHTHTFLPPLFMETLMKVKAFQDFDFGKRRILTGSSPVSWDILKAFIDRNAILQPNWGMSEIGPLTICSTLFSLADLDRLQRGAPANASLLGDTFYTDYKVLENQLYVKSPMCVYGDWFATGDMVRVKDGVMYYFGRQSGEKHLS